MDNLVIFFRDQKMTIDQHKDFARRSGRCTPIPMRRSSSPSHPEILVIKADEKSKHVAGEEWHSDVSARRRAADGLDPLPHRGPARWRRHAVRQHVPRLRDAVRADQADAGTGSPALHDSSKAHYYRVKATDRDDIKFPNAEHPMVRTHPVTGRRGALRQSRLHACASRSSSSIESDALLEMLYRHIETPEFQCRFRWQANSVAFWDNRCAQHHAMFDYFPHRRYGHRVTVCGHKPFYRAA